MNVHPAIKIIRINYTSYGVSYSFTNIDSSKRRFEENKQKSKEKEKLHIKKNQ